MALKTEKQPEASLNANTTVLELALYTKYTWQGVTYEAGKPYRFRNNDALILMGEQDLGRPVWRIYRPPPVKRAPRNEIVDATAIQALPQDVEELTLMAGDQKPKRIDIGDDSEIADILNTNEGDVTV